MFASPSGHVTLQHPQVQKFTGLFDLLCQEAWLSTERFTAQHGAGCNSVSQGLDRVSWLFLQIMCPKKYTIMFHCVLIIEFPSYPYHHMFTHWSSVSGSCNNCLIWSMCFSTRAKLSYYSKVPETEGPPPYLTKATITEMQTGLDLDSIKTANKKIIKRTFHLLFSVSLISHLCTQ